MLPCRRLGRLGIFLLPASEIRTRRADGAGSGPTQIGPCEEAAMLMEDVVAENIRGETV